MRLMVQSLLAERFQLAAHFEMKEAAVFNLTLAKSGTLGPNLRPHAEGPPCDAAALNAPTSARFIPLDLPFFSLLLLLVTLLSGLRLIKSSRT